MNFSKEWEGLYNANMQISSWPWTNLVSYVMRYAPPDKPGFKVLELGCGSGANIPFFIKSKVEYYAIEGSSIAVERLWRKYPELKEHILVGDFTKDIPFEMKFDLVVDRGSLTHNSAKAIKICLGLVYEKLKKGGKYIGIDWFSTQNTEYGGGQEDEDIYTRSRYQEGNFLNMGRAHFSDKEHLIDLFSKFTIIRLEHQAQLNEIPQDEYNWATWNLVASKCS